VRDEKFVFNDEYTLTKGSNPAYFANNELSFPALPPWKPDGFYKTRFGPGFETNAVIYSRSDINMRYGMRRLLNVRCPDIPGYHQHLLNNQRIFIDSNLTFLTYIKELYAPHFMDYLGAEEEMYLHYADPHIKRSLRIRAHDEMIEENVCSNCDHIWLRDVLWKIKPEEWAKYGKKPRCICDLGVSASLRGFILTNILKLAQSEEPIHLYGGSFAFCKTPDPFELKRHFDLLRDPPGRFYFLYFSDYACLAIRDDKGDVQWFNLDISSCDASHGLPLFEALINLMPSDTSREDMRKLVRQCSAPLRVVSCADKYIKIKIKPKRPILMSGSTLTTGINNLANLLIGVSIVTSFNGGKIGIENEGMIFAAAKAGYILTGCTPLEFFEDIQFLKHSPVQDKFYEWHPMLNLGVLYRASGTCNGDLPGSKKQSLFERGTIFQRSLLRGAYPYLDFEILRKMKGTCGPGVVVDTKAFTWKVVADADKYPITTILDESIIRRYRLTSDEYLELVEVATYGFGWFFNTTGASKVLEKDYGLSTVERSDVQYGSGIESDFGFNRDL
jgi:hypothetical protein